MHSCTPWENSCLHATVLPKILPVLNYTQFWFSLKKNTENCIYYIFMYKYIYDILLCVYINIDIYLYIKTHFSCFSGLCLESRQHPWLTEPMEHGNGEEKEFFPSPSFHLLLPQLPSPHMDEKEHHQTFPMFPIFCASPGKAPS